MGRCQAPWEGWTRVPRGRAELKAAVVHDLMLRTVNHLGGEHLDDGGEAGSGEELGA